MATAQSPPAETASPAEQPPSLWRNRDYMYWWTGNGLSTLGTSVSTLAFPLLVLHATGSVAQAGTITTLHMLGALATLAVGGALADRVSRRAILCLSPLVQGIAMAVVAYAVHRGDPSMVLLGAMALLSGAAGGLRSSVTLPVLRRIVPKEQVGNATAQSMGRDMVAELVGGPLGGLLYSVGRWVPFLFDALSFLFVTLGSLLIRRPLGPDPHTGDGPRPGLVADTTDALRMIRRSEYLRFTVVWGALLNIVAEGFTLLFIVLVQHRGGGPTDVGTATSLALAGGLIGAVTGPWLMERLGARTVLLASAWVFVASFAAVVWVPRPWQIGLVLMVAMTSMVPLNVVTESYQVRLVPDAYLGRVASANLFCVRSVQWLGPLLAGVLADAAGVRPAILVLAGVMVLLALALHAARRQLAVLDTPLAEVEELPAPGGEPAKAPANRKDPADPSNRTVMTHPAPRVPAPATVPAAAVADPEVLASDHDRDRTAERVRAAAAEGRIDLAEVDRRISAVYEARTLGELTEASRGLPEPGPRDGLVVDRAPTSRLALGIFGGFEREGEWVLPEKFTAWSMFGGGMLDLSEARFSAPETRITAVALWGGTEILVPDDIEVEVRGFGLFGLFGRRGARRGLKPGTPRVVIRGLAMWGAVVTKTKSTKDAPQQ
jgi:MFS family permease